MKKKYSLTLLEIMIVIFLIGLIGSVIGYNMKGSLDEGRAFKTKQAAEQIHDILVMEIAKGADVNVVIKNKEKFLANSGLVKDASKLLKDGWGNNFEIKPHGDSDIYVISEKYRSYLRGKKSKLGLDIENEDEHTESEEG